MSLEKKKMREKLGGEVGDPDCPLNMGDGNDRRQLRLALSDGWEITPEKLKKYSEYLDKLIEYAMDGDKIHSRVALSCIKTLKSITDQIQTQEIINHKYDRIDDGKVTDLVGIYDEAELARIDAMARRTDENFELKLSDTG